MDAVRRIYGYDSYRVFLRDYYRERKKRDGLTYARFAKLAGLQSPNYLKLVIDGRRNLTVANIHRFADAMELLYEERLRFESLVLRDQSRSPRTRAFYERKLSERGGSVVPPQRLVRRKDVIEKWYYPAILFAIHQRPKDTPATEVARLAGISVEDAARGIDVLRQRKLLKVARGRFQATHRFFLIHDPKNLMEQKRLYLEAQLDRSLEAYRKLYGQGAHFQARTFSIPVGELDRIHSRLASFIDRIAAEAERRPMDRIAQLNLQLFGLSDLAEAR